MKKVAKAHIIKQVVNFAKKTANSDNFKVEIFRKCARIVIWCIIMNINKIIQYGLMASNIIFTSAIFVAGGVLSGLYVDYLFGTKSIFTMLLSVLGLGLAIWSMIASILKNFNSR